MYNRTAKKLNIPMRIAGVLLLLVLISAYSMSGLFARYTVSKESSDQARVGAFAFSVQDDSQGFELDLTEVNYPGANKTFTFTVSNTKGETVSEVAQKIYADIQTEGEIPFVIILELDHNEVVRLDLIHAAEASCDIAEFAANTADSKKITLTVEWPVERNSVEYAGKTAKVTLDLTAEQID